MVYNYIPLDDLNVYEITAAGVSDTVTFSQGAVTTVNESLRFNDDDSAYLTRTPASAGNRKTYTFSAWVKFSAAATNQFIFSGAGGSARWGLYLSSAGKLATDLQFTGTYNESLATYRDPSAWYHLVWKVDTTAPTAIDRSVIYINGNRIADANTRTLSLNADTNINDAAAHYISNTSSPNWYFDGYMSDVYFIDGEALEWAHRRALARREQRKILMVISDGAPVDDSTLSVNPANYLEKHLRDVITMIERKKAVELLAIGIGHDVTRYYQHAVTITDVDQLAGAMTEQLAGLFDRDPRARARMLGMKRAM